MWMPTPVLPNAKHYDHSDSRKSMRPNGPGRWGVFCKRCRWRKGRSQDR